MAGEASTKAIIKAVASILATVDGVGLVSDRPLGLATWVTDKRPARAYWEVDFQNIAETEPGVGTQEFEFHGIVVHGWMPASRDMPNTFDDWRDLVDAVRLTFRENRTLRGLVNDVAPPQVPEANLITTSGGGNSPEVLCHHVRFDLRVRNYIGSYMAF